MERERDVPHRPLITDTKRNMSKITKTSPMTQGRVIDKLFTPSLAAAAVIAILPISARAAEVDLTVVDDTPQPVAADFGGDALVANFHTHPSGTGVFDPFLTLERNAAGGNSAGIESAYNTDGHSALYLDQQIRVATA